MLCVWPSGWQSGSPPAHPPPPPPCNAAPPPPLTTTVTDLRGLAVLVTGAAWGIGRASALAFAAAGARVAAADVDAAALAALGPGILPVYVDVRDPSSVEAMVATVVERFGRLDVAHNNAGVAGPFQPLWEYKEH